MAPLKLAVSFSHQKQLPSRFKDRAVHSTASKSPDLAQSRNSHMPPAPPEFDLEGLARNLLNRIARRCALEDTLAQYLTMHAKMHGGEEPEDSLLVAEAPRAKRRL